MVSSESPAAGGAREVLVVCRANRARSPVVAEVLRQYAAEHHLTSVQVCSSGLDARDGEPLLPSMRRALGRRTRLDLDGHESRAFRVDEVSAADLVITFEGTLRRAILARRPSAVPRTFTLKELVRLSTSGHWRPEWNGTPDVAARLHRIRPLVEPGDDESRDPVEAGRRATRHLLDDLVRDAQRVAPTVLGSGERLP